MNTFKLLGLLLSYPQPGWLDQLDAFRSVLKEEGLLTGKSLKAVLSFLDTLEQGDLYALQAEDALLEEKAGKGQESLGLETVEVVMKGLEGVEVILGEGEGPRRGSEPSVDD